MRLPHRSTRRWGLAFKVKTPRLRHFALGGRTWLRAALTSQPMPMALVGLAIKLALMLGTRVVPFVRIVALGFVGIPLAIWIVCANELIALGTAWNDASVI